MCLIGQQIQYCTAGRACQRNDCKAGADPLNACITEVQATQHVTTACASGRGVTSTCSSRAAIIALKCVCQHASSEQELQAVSCASCNSLSLARACHSGMLPSCLRGLKHLATKHSSGLCTRLPRAAQYSVSPIFPHTCRRWLQQPSAAAARKMSSAASASPTPADVGAVPRPTARLAVAQMTSVGDTEANFATCAALAKEAAAGGAQLLCLPEVFSFIGASQAESLAVAQPLSGPLMSRYRALAADSGLWLSLGGFQEEGPDPQHIYNCHVVVDPCGEVVGAYRKIHLFDVDVPQGPVLQESSTTAPGDKLVAVDTPVGRLGLSVCYDLRFPELYQELTWGLGAQLLLVPSAFTQVTGAAHWEVLLRARAIECQAYVVAAAQAGRHNHKRASYGHSLVVDPWGTVVGRLEDPGATGVALVDIDLGQLAAVRAKMPIEAHRAAGRARWAGTAASS